MNENQMDSSQPTDQLDPVVHEWLNLFDNHKFTVLELRKFWSIHVPNLFNIPINNNSIKFKFDQNEIDKILFDRLEQFICASSNPKDKLESIKSDHRPNICGKVFKSNEPIFNCRDCGVDSSCVRCVDCFKNSSHKNHKYKVVMSSMNGMCDCGDPEAWKSDPYCDIHKENNSISSENLDDGLKKRFEIVMKTALNYCFELLCWENHVDLPKDLESKESKDLNHYTTVVFNDEIHTFDQVIASLTRAIGCVKKEARDFSSLIDREGRAFVKINSFEECKKVKNTIERSTSNNRSALSKPIKCEVIQMNVIAHQEHCLQLLDWIKKIISYSSSFRQIFSLVMQSNVLIVQDDQEVYQGVNLLESIIINDANLWKTPRNLWHKLFINGMIMDTESKKFFAKAFTKLYDQLMQDFISDNHESNYSVIHLSIQFYSVPSLAHSLIENDDALHLISKSFYKECSKHLVTANKNTKLQIKRDQTNSFKRSQTVLNDLKYLLVGTPSEWNDNLRKSFLHGFDTIVTILKWMQDMDSIVRQVGQHLEYESDWELAIYLQLRMASVVTQLFEWCSTDFKVLKRSVNIALENLNEKMDKSPVLKTWKLSDVSCRCIDYDVSSLSVTIHLPLSRAVAGLLLELSKHNVKYSDLDSPVTLIELLELPLRTLVMVSQFRASMWRRNGFSLVNQIIFYHSPSCREEMFDKDIIMLQYVGAILDPNEYLMHLLNKFGLAFWVQDNYESTQRKLEEDLIRQTSVLVEEFLNLFLIVVSERHTCGIGKVTNEDKIKKEIIQWLCVEPRTHSDLIRNLTKPSATNVPIESIINEVAIFKKQKDNQSGKYELKNQYYDEFNPFFYHYSRTDQCSAEETQLKRKKQNKEQFVCCHPPVPPELTDAFKPLRNLLNSKIFLHLVKVILTRVCDTSTRSFSENQYEKTLHLIGVALHEEKRDLDNKEIDEDSKFKFTEEADKIELVKLLEDCKNCQRVTSHQVLTSWVLDKFKSLVKERQGKLETSLSENETSKSRNESPKKAALEESSCKRNSMAADLRKRIMDQMCAMQNKFIEENSEYFQNKDEEKQQQTSDNSSPTDDNQLMFVDSDPIALGTEQRGKYIDREPFFCMLCRENEDLTNSTTTCMVMAGFAQKSTVLSKNRKRKISINQRKRNQPEIPDTQSFTMSSDLYCGTHVSTCGHTMHLECFDHFFESVRNKERRRPIRYGRYGSFNVDLNEFLCPLCECLSNMVIPLIPGNFYRNTLCNPKSSKIKLNMNDWLSVMFSLVSSQKSTGDGFLIKRKVKLEPIEKIVNDLNLDEESKVAFKLLEEVYEENATKESSFDPQLNLSIKRSSKSINSVELGREVEELSDRSALFIHWSCSFTIQSLEKLLREEYKPTFGDLSSRNHSSLQVLIRYCSINSIVYDFNAIRNHCIDLLNYLLVNEKYNLNPSSILDVDAFSILISLALTSASLFIKDDESESKLKSKKCLTLPLGNVNDQYLVQLMVLFHVVQIILTQKEFYQQTPMELDDNQAKKEIKNSENRLIAMFYIDILKVAGIKSAYNDVKQLNSVLVDNIASMIKSKLLPFLRCTALFFHFLTEIMPPKKLTDDFLQSNSAMSIEDIEEKEFVILCEYLALPKKLSELFKNVNLVKLAQSWARHPRISLIFEEDERSNKSVDGEDHKLDSSYLPFKLIKQPHTTNQLIKLPEDYTELINNVSLLPCPNSTDSNETRCSTLCLVCGTMLCSSYSCVSCKQDIDGEHFGSCYYHSIECGAGTGVFLRTTDCRILLLGGKSKGCFLPAPYIDEYGETDTGLRRGNPLRLCEKTYKNLRLLWLKHGIPEQVARMMEAGTSNAETRDWNFF